jgi:hypothetical protein
MQAPRWVLGANLALARIKKKKEKSGLPLSSNSTVQF